MFLTLTNISWAASSTEDITTQYPIGTTTKGGTVLAKVYNGRFWSQLHDDQKAVSIAGIEDGVTAYSITSGNATAPNQIELFEITNSYLAYGFSPSELANVIDDIYKDNSNVRIPISEVLRVAVKKT